MLGRDVKLIVPSLGAIVHMRRSLGRFQKRSGEGFVSGRFCPQILTEKSLPTNVSDC
jgi:hypothetical protein